MLLLINGKIENYNYILQENNKIIITLTPNETTALIVTTIVVALVAVATDIACRIYAYKAKKG